MNKDESWSYLPGALLSIGLLSWPVGWLVSLIDHEAWWAAPAYISLVAFSLVIGITLGAAIAYLFVLLDEWISKET